MQLDLTALTAAVTLNKSVVASALTLIAGFNDKLNAALAAATAAGATPAQLQQITDLSASLTADDTALAAAVAANTPAAPAPVTP